MPEVWFKLAFVLAFAWAAIVATMAAKSAARHHGGPLNQLAHEVRGLQVVRAALGLVFYSVLISWLFLPRALAWSYFPLPSTVRWLGVAALLPTLLHFAWSFQSLGTNYRGGVGLYLRHELVTTGAYHRTRHPIYAGFIAIMLLVLIVSANWVLGLSGILLVGTIAAIRIPIEERQLHERFGLAWERYRDRTGRVLPRQGDIPKL